jgi:hypothetical protein
MMQGPIQALQMLEQLASENLALRLQLAMRDHAPGSHLPPARVKSSHPVNYYRPRLSEADFARAEM